MLMLSFCAGACATAIRGIERKTKRKIAVNLETNIIDPPTAVRDL
jgi:hypothetical protein